MRISKKASIHYILLYLAIAFQGSVIYKLFDFYYMVFVLGCTFLFLLSGGYKRLNKKYALWALAICALLGMNHFYTNGSTSIGTVGNFFSRFCIAFLCIAYDEEHAIERLQRIIVFIATLNLVEFAIGLTPANRLFSVFPSFDSNGITYNCSIFFAARVSDMSRNSGMFGEPGVYQIILNVGLVLLLFSGNAYFSEKKRRKNIIIILLALVSTQSTTGYLAMLIILTAFIFSDTNYKENRWLKVMVLLGTLAFAGIVVFGGSDSFIYERFTSKLFGAGGGLDLSNSTGRYREISMTTDMMIAVQNPFGVGTEMYKTWWNRFVYDWSNTNGSVVGLTRYCATYGFLFTGMAIIFLITSIKKNSESIWKMVAIIGAIFATVISQPHILYVMYLMLAYPERQIKSRKVNK